MTLSGRVSAMDDGMTVSIRGMVTQMAVFNIHSDNIANYGMPGYQRKDPVVTSFAEHLGPNGVDSVTSTEVGRLRLTEQPLDLALNMKGYFQRLNKLGSVELSRDGRMQIDRQGFLRSMDGKQVLSTSGQPLQLSIIPKDLKKQLSVSSNGEIHVFDAKSGKMVSQGTIAVANMNGSLLSDVDVKQGYVEDSNVYLAKEFTSILPLRRQFEANRQLFIIQSDTMSRMIQELGRAQ
ncbi:MAG: hypothetical protein K2X01_06725 [Cyanobacteria bacterium]|nr:hypothetical protein [Cyanobacteriota bacterium]